MKPNLLIAGSMAVCGVFPRSAFATDVHKSIAACSAISGDLSRLECFDKLSKSLGLNGPKKIDKPMKGKGLWNFSLERNPVDDSKTAIASIDATSGSSKWGKPISLVLRCQSKKVEVYISWGMYLGMDTTQVLTRMGDHPADSDSWNNSSDNTGTFFSGDAVDFIRALRKEKKFLAQTTPYSENPITAIFNVSGANVVGNHVLQVCGIEDSTVQTESEATADKAPEDPSDKRKH